MSFQSLQSTGLGQRFVTSKDGERTVLVPATDELHRLAWGRLYQGSKPAHVTGPVPTLTEAEARIWLNRERAVGQISMRERLAALRAPVMERAA